ncbi:hypothetical protein Plhal304r1_c072g0160651 [Plasmopara halstedii]
MTLCTSDILLRHLHCFRSFTLSREYISLPNVKRSRCEDHR